MTVVNPENEFNQILSAEQKITGIAMYKLQRTKSTIYRPCNIPLHMTIVTLNCAIRQRLVREHSTILS